MDYEIFKVANRSAYIHRANPKAPVKPVAKYEPEFPCLEGRKHRYRLVGHGKVDMYDKICVHCSYLVAFIAIRSNEGHYAHKGAQWRPRKVGRFDGNGMAKGNI